MLPETILQSDVLDILFENRNKSYGAYILRKQYNARMAKAIMSVAVFALLLALLMNFNKGGNAGRVVKDNIPDVVTLIEIPPDKFEPKKTQPARQQPTAKPLPQVKFIDKIDIVKIPVTDTIPKVKELDENNIGDKKVAGNVIATGEKQTGNSNGYTGLPEVKKEEVTSETPIELAEIMPRYPGGNDAFQKFMQRNLKQPDDLEAGEKILVIVRFVVEKDGSITGAQLINSGRGDLDENVLKTVGKMPRWIPGLQNGRKVAVYFKLPVTFVSQEQ